MHTRRKFIKIGSLGLGAVALTSGVVNWVAGAASAKNSSNGSQSLASGKKVATYCEVCFWKCAGWSYVTPNGQIQKIIGNDDDPQCNGRLCPRGTGGVGMFSDPDRLKTPLMRVTKDGEQTYREATWDEALNFIATKMKEIREKHGTESMALFNHGSSGKYFTHLLNAFGSNNVAAPSLHNVADRAIPVLS